MNEIITIVTIVAYFFVLLLVSHFTSRNATNDSFFRAGRRSPWYLVAFGMIGTSVSAFLSAIWLFLFSCCQCITGVDLQVFILT